jgi:ribosomal protein L25 (general stress protein Ctc)
MLGWACSFAQQVNHTNGSQRQQFKGGEVRRLRLAGKYGAVILYELEYLPSLLEKMLTAFFKMSRSICASRSCFF